jgi:hypothetical protein
MNKEVQRQLHQEEKKERLQAKEIPLLGKKSHFKKPSLTKKAALMHRDYNTKPLLRRNSPVIYRPQPQ